MNPMVKRRDMLVQVLLFVITFGFYGLYWFYQTALEMRDLANDPEAAPGLWTVFFFIPLLNVYALYKYSELFEDISEENLNLWILFALWIFFPPAVWFLVQTDLNRKASGFSPATV